MGGVSIRPSSALAAFKVAVSRYDSLMTRQLFIAVVALGIAAPALAQDRPKIGETITTESGLVYKFTQLGNGPQPQTGDLMVIHGIGTLVDGKEFWNTRADGMDRRRSGSLRLSACSRRPHSGVSERLPGASKRRISVTRSIRPPYHDGGRRHTCVSFVRSSC